MPTITAIAASLLARTVLLIDINRFLLVPDRCVPLAAHRQNTHASPTNFSRIDEPANELDTASPSPFSYQMLAAERQSVCRVVAMPVQLSNCERVYSKNP